MSNWYFVTVYNICVIPLLCYRYCVLHIRSGVGLGPITRKKTSLRVIKCNFCYVCFTQFGVWLTIMDMCTIINIEHPCVRNHVSLVSISLLVCLIFDSFFILSIIIKYYIIVWMLFMGVLLWWHKYYLLVYFHFLIT